MKLVLAEPYFDSVEEWAAFNEAHGRMQTIGAGNHRGENPRNSVLATHAQIFSTARTDMIPGVGGIYFLIHDREIVYIGQARDIMARLFNHIAARKITFESFAFVRCDGWLDNHYERLYTHEYWPCENIKNKPSNHPKNWWDRLKCTGCNLSFMTAPGTTVPCPLCETLVSFPAKTDGPPLAPVRIRVGEIRARWRAENPPTPKAKPRSPFELLCLRAHGTLKLAHEALRMPDADFNACVSGACIVPGCVEEMLKAEPAKRAGPPLPDGNYPRPFYSVMTPERFFLTVREAADAHGLTVETTGTRARSGSKNWYFVPYGFDPTKAP